MDPVTAAETVAVITSTGGRAFAVVDTHLRGTFTCGRAAAIAMREQGDGGRIAVIGSPAGQFGSFGQTNYAAVKAGLVAMARTWSLELVRAYTQVYEDFLATGEIPREYRSSHALGTPEDVAPLLVWLASERSAHVTGQAIGIGGD